MSILKLPATILILSLFVVNASSEISVMVFSKDEGLSEKNISKPRIFIKNTGTEPVSNFYYIYYFTAEQGCTPVLEDYYTPNESISLHYLGHNRYAVYYDFSGVTLYPGEILPNRSGNVIGIHYQNWEPLKKGNDRSCIFSNNFTPNFDIAVFCEDGSRIYGHNHFCSIEKPEKRRTHSDQVSISIDISNDDINLNGTIRKVQSGRTK